MRRINATRGWRSIGKLRWPLRLLAVLIAYSAVTNVTLQRQRQRQRQRQPLVADHTTDRNKFNLISVDCEGSLQVDETQIHVIGWRRLQPLESLLVQLETSNYNGWDNPIPLYIHLDGGAHHEVITLCDEFHWTHGEKHLDIRIENEGLRNMWLSSIGSAAKAAGENSLMVVFEDDMIVDSGYFQWLLAVVDAYGRNTGCRDSNLMGFSLSPIRVNEMKVPFKRWDARAIIGDGALAYLSVVPSSWGAAYWSDRWNEFAEFANVRVKPPYYDVRPESLTGVKYDNLLLTPPELFIPGSRSNFWPKSWKRFMIDWMYARGLFMLYPNLPGEKGLATTTALASEHTNSKSGNPRIADLDGSFDRERLGSLLPKYRDLTILGLQLQRTTRESLAYNGATFIRGVQAKCFHCDELLEAWASDGAHLKESVMSPSICAPDLYRNSQVSSVLNNWTNTPQNASQRYLLYEPQYGGNNQIVAMAEALKWARVLDRQLVLPPIFLPRVSEFYKELVDWPVMEKHLIVNDPSSNRPPIGFQEWLKLKTPLTRILRISREAIFDRKSSLLTNVIVEAHAGTPVPTVDMRHIFKENDASYDTIKRLFGGCSDQVLAFECMFFVNINAGKGVNHYELFDAATKFSDKSLKTLNTVQARLHERLGGTEYACYHVRLGDFISMCDYVSSHKNKTLGYWKEMIRQGYKCVLSAEDLGVAVLSRGMPALVMSNNATLLKDMLKSIAIPTVSSEWVHKIIAEEIPHGMNEADLDLLSLLIEQELCANAQFSRLNRMSTFSARVASMRESRGSPYDYWMSHEK